ncbi:MAG: hypothetical protein ACYC75_01265 [Minisyncoccota bacterium]
MNSGNRPLFHEIEPPRELFPAILARIALARRRAARLRLAAFGTVALASALALIPVVQYAMSEFRTSGFYDYASLFFDSLSWSYWKELLYSLAVSVPSIALLLLVATGAALVWSLRQTNRNARIAFTRVTLPA